MYLSEKLSFRKLGVQEVELKRGIERAEIAEKKLKVKIRR